MVTGMNEIRVNIKFFAELRDIVGKRESTFSLPEGSRVDYMLEALKNEYPRLAKTIECSFIALNEVYVDRDAPLKEGDTLAIIPPVSGG